MKRLILLVLLYWVMQPMPAAGDLKEKQLDRGIKNSDTQAWLLMGKAAGMKGADAVNLLKQAVVIAPDLPEAYFALAMASFSPKSGDILNSIDYAVEGFRAYSQNIWSSFSLAGLLFFCILSALMLSFAVVAFIRLFPDVPLVSHNLRESPYAVLLLPVLVVLALLGPLLFLAGILIMTGIYFSNKDRIIVYLYLFFLIISPIVFGAASWVAGMASSGPIKAILQVKEARDNNYALTVLRNKNDFPAQFTYALALKRSGQYDKAIDLYKTLLSAKPDARVYVNLGNCYVGLYNFDEGKKAYLDEAVKAYLSSLNIKPLASANYNLSQVYREMLDFPRGQEYFKAALNLDRDAVSTYSSISGRTPNRLVADESLSTAEICNYPGQRRYPRLSFGLSNVPLFLVSALALLLSAAFYVISSQFKQKAYRCRKCSIILCPSCEKYSAWGHMCAQCYGSLVKLDELDSKERVSRIFAIQDRQTRRKSVMRVLSFIVPGAAQIYAGRIIQGFLFLLPFLFFVFVAAAIDSPVYGQSQISNMFYKYTSAGIAAVLYIIITIITGQRISKGWL